MRTFLALQSALLSNPPLPSLVRNPNGIGRDWLDLHVTRAMYVICGGVGRSRAGFRCP